jgi:hypothetical protein
MLQEIITATLASTAIILAVLGFLGRSIIKRWIDKDLANYKAELELSNAKDLERLRADLQITAFEYQTRFASLHQERAKVLDQLYKLLSEVERNLILATRYTHLNAEDDRPWKEKKIQSEKMYKETFEATIQFETYFEKNRHYLNSELCDRIEKLVIEFVESIQDLEITHVPSSSDIKGPGPAILALWKVEKKVRVIIPPIKQEIEEEFRKLLGVVKNEADQ